LLTGVGQEDLSDRAPEQRAIETFLEFSNLITDGVLGDTQFLCSQAKTELARCRLENLKARQAQANDV